MTSLQKIEDKIDAFKKKKLKLKEAKEAQLAKAKIRVAERQEDVSLLKSIIKGLSDVTKTITDSVIDKIEITNTKDIASHIKFPKEIEVTNHPTEIEVTNPQKEVTVTNPQKEVTILNHQKEVEVTGVKGFFKKLSASLESLPKRTANELGKTVLKIDLSDIIKAEESKYGKYTKEISEAVKEVTIEVDTSEMTEMIAKALDDVSAVEVVNEKPIKVIAVDKDGRPADMGGSSYAATQSSGDTGRRERIDTNQVKVAVTATAVNLPDVECHNGLLITNGGTTVVTLGGSDVNNTTDGTGNGYILAVGATVSAAVKNANAIWMNGTADTSYISFLVT